MKKILFVGWVIFPATMFCQETLAVRITRSGYGDIRLGHTTIQEAIAQTGSGYKVDTITYQMGLANLGGGCIPLTATKIVYRYKKLGITYIASGRGMVSGIIFYPPFKGQTEKGIKLKKTSISSLDSVNSGARSCMLGRQASWLSLRFSENADGYCSVEGIRYGYKRFRLRKRVSEIRIGE